MARTVLLIEDDPRVRKVLALALQDEGFRVHQAADGAQGLERAEQEGPDVVLLDLMLPDTDGFAVCRAIRRRSDMPIIMVTARTDSHDVVAGLEAGADDYVTKPLIAKELSARIRALLRRAAPHLDPASPTPPPVRAGDLQVGLGDGVVLLAGEQVSVTHTEYRLLVELALAAGGICSREHLLEQVWGYDYFGDSRIVDVHVRRLRTKVEHDPGSPEHVVTVRGQGYRLTV